MAYNFPDTPTVGQAYSGYVWDGEKWQAQGTTMQNAVRYDIAQGLTANQTAQARANIAVTKRNFLINGAFQINQGGYVSAAVLAAAAYGHDQWKAGASGGDYSFNTTFSVVNAGAVTNAVGNVDAATARSQSFTVPANGTTVNSVSITSLRKTGSPADNVKVDIYLTDGAGKPIGSSLGTSTTVAGTTITTTPTNYAFTFTAPVSVSANVQYAAVLSRTAALDGANFYYWISSATDVIAAEKSCLYTGSTTTWAAVTSFDLPMTVSISTMITIAAGKSLIQPIEDVRVTGGGSYVLAWTGTAQARAGINTLTPTGAYAASPLLISGQTDGAVMSVEFNTGTLSNVGLYEGSVAPPFQVPDYPTEMLLCQRYVRLLGDASTSENYANGQCTGTTTATFVVQLNPVMRAAPTLTHNGTLAVYNASSGLVSATAIVLGGSSTPRSAILNVTVASGLVAGNATTLVSNGAVKTLLGARL